MKWKTLAKAGLAVALSTALLFGCSSKNNADPNGQKTLTLATSADYKPYEYTDTATGKVIGFDIDLANMIAKELKLKIEVKDMDFNGLIPALQSKRADLIMAGMTPTPERKKSVDFSDIYYESKNTIITKKGSNLTTAKSLIGKKVGVQLGSIQEKEAQKLKLNAISINKVPEIIQELKAGRIEAAIVENTIAEGYTTNNPDLSFTDLPNSEPTGSAIAFPKGSGYVKNFNQVLKHLKENGKLDELIKKWFQK
ncbi:transporter substrate-binding domain-containing protein [Shimazuella sp. AN120528]|uniref:transporter substrate-binding domain-containing protein n=1 Tax=Shimazuella soli TaxID=1892854 RepID=UPI001F0D9355|nr:transporter substrate-binding domain-containing protein [Shimazuella soli]MCH5586134.1 transporter substrate-binding domain-containing protein [Shimazuella soli]